MPIFEYNATDAEGKTIRGTQVAKTESDVHSQLSKRGLQVQWVSNSSQAADPLTQIAAPPVVQNGAGVAVQQMPSDAAAQIHIPKLTQSTISVQQAFFGTPSNEVLSFFFSQGAVMLDAGLSAYEMLDSQIRNAQSKVLQHILQDIIADVDAGKMMSGAMARHPEAFSPVILYIVQAGEVGGFLSDAFRQVSDYLEQLVAMSRAARAQTMMPKLIIVFALILTVGVNALIQAIRPGATKMYNPMLTPQFWMVALPILAFIFVYRRYLGKLTGFGGIVDYLRLIMPGFSDVERLNSMSRFSRSFAALYKAGASMPDNLALSAQSCGNRYVCQRMELAIPAVENGASVSDALASTGALSGPVIDMLKTGERTGKIDETMGYIARNYEQEAKVRASRNAMIQGILFYVAAAILVFFMMLNFYTSYFTGLINSADE